jgi:Ras GTPase-activating-like protein IQGAP2/3
VVIRNLEEQFDIDEFNDLYARQKPTLYIKMVDVFAIHHVVSQDMAYICPNKDDALRDLVAQLGNAKSNESEMISVSAQEIRLTLNPKLMDLEDPDAHAKALFMETKRCILYIIRVQTAKNLMEILVKPITAEDVQRWDDLLKEEKADKRRAPYSDATTLVDITSLTYAELKRTALENILELEKLGRASRHNQYQDLLNSMAIDIRTKHRRRLQRQKEIESSKMTLTNLGEKASYLEQQLKSYNDYIEQAMVTLQSKKGKKRFLVPFTKQYNHERELQRSGRIPKFGSYKYSARSLADKGVLVHYHGYLEKQYDKINLTISSDEVGVFCIEGSMGSIQMPGASARVPLDDLLQVRTGLKL